MTQDLRLDMDDKGHPRIDTTGMEPPGPFVAIMRWMETNPEATDLIVVLERDPIHLFPELTERNWDWTYLSEVPGSVKLHLKRIPE